MKRSRNPLARRVQKPARSRPGDYVLRVAHPPIAAEFRAPTLAGMLGGASALVALGMGAYYAKKCIDMQTEIAARRARLADLERQTAALRSLVEARYALMRLPG